MSIIEEALRKAAKLQEEECARRPVLGASPPVQATVNPTELARQHLITLADPNSPAAEEYRKLREILIERGESQSGFNNVFLITSATPEEGKTLTTLNLSVALSQAFDHTVLVMDADFRRPCCHRYLGIDMHAGLSDCLLKGLPLSSVLIKTDIGKLVLLPAGTEQESANELFASNIMKDLIVELKHRYPDRYILIDSPPILRYAGTRSLCALADGVLLVVREDFVCLDEVEEAIRAVGNKLLGVVYNASVSAKNAQNYSLRTFS